MPLVVKTTAAIQTMKLKGGHTGYGSSLQFDATDAGGLNFELVSGGSGTGGGMNSKFSIRDVANNAPRLTIDSAGNVGLGITSPSGHLHIAESTSAAANIRITNSTTGTGSSSGLRVSLEADENTTIMNHSNTNLNLGVNGLNVISIKGGSVGIGTTTPSKHLHIYSSTSTGIRLDRSGNYWDAKVSAAYGLQFNNGSDRIIFDANGNVGIGTTSPDRPLHVYTGTAMDDVVKVYQNHTGGHAFIKSQRNGGAIWWAGATRNVGDGGIRANTAIVATWTNHDMDFMVNAAQVMTLKSGGDVGIGTTAPGEKLQISGTEAVIKLVDTAATSAGYVDFDGTALQLNTNRNPNTGAFSDTGKSHASIILSGAAGGSSILFYTKDSNNATGTQRMAIESDGTLNLKSSKFKINGSGGTNGYTIVTDGSGNISWSSAGTGTVTGTGTANYVSKWTGTSSQGNSLIQDNGTGVGIGIAPNNSYMLRIDGNMLTGSGQWHYWGGSTVGIRDKSGTGLEFKTGGNTNVTILSDGNVGIGTTAPEYPLHISSADSAIYLVGSDQGE